MNSTTSGNTSTAVGHNSLYNNVSGAENSAFGGGSLGSNTTGSYNLAAGRAAGGANKTGNYNVMLGYGAGPSTTGLSNAITLGANTSVSASNTAIIGNSSITQIGGAVAWSNLSDRRLKSNITNSERGLDFIKKLRPVDYLLTSNGKRETGFIAQEVEEADPKFEGINKPTSDKDFYSLNYTDFIPSIVRSIQELDQRSKRSINNSEVASQISKLELLVSLLLATISLLVGVCFYALCRLGILEKRIQMLSS